MKIKFVWIFMLTSFEDILLGRLVTSDRGGGKEVAMIPPKLQGVLVNC
jgi:hypothetical protein